MCNNKIYKRIIFNYRHWEIFSNGIIYCLKKQKNLNNNFTNWNERGRKKKKEEEVKRILGILFNERSKVPIQTVSKGEPLPVSITVSGYRFKRSTARGQNYQRKNSPNNVQREREKNRVYGDKHLETVQYPAPFSRFMANWNVDLGEYQAKLAGNLGRPVYIPRTERPPILSRNGHPRRVKSDSRSHAHGTYRPMYLCRHSLAHSLEKLEKNLYKNSHVIESFKTFETIYFRISFRNTQLKTIKLNVGLEYSQSG